MSSLSGRIALITGASAGIGLATAEALAASGCKLIINARRAEKLAALAARLGPSVVPVSGDCADDAVIARALDTAKSRFGGEADLIIINAGRGLGGTAITSDAAQWDDMIRTNILAAARLIRAAGPRLLAMIPTDQTGHAGTWLRRPRDIIILGSVVGRHVSPFSSFYSATKAAIQSLAEGTRRELGPRGIRVSLVEPAFVTSEFQGVAGYTPEWYTQMVEKFGPMLEPADVARTIRFIAEQPAHVHASDILIRPTRQEYP
ncbi:MAG: SDR family NAD(P)-dependent oxidoreductase [Phycisphaerales bacterium]